MAASPGDAASVASDLSGSQHDSEFQDNLHQVLKGIQTSGSVAAFQALSSIPISISVDGVGDIAMPLNQTQAQQLIAKARQAPYGKGSQTLVDTSVRNTWELDPEQFTLTSPAWYGYFRQLCAKVALQMGIEATVRADLYKMLIYEEGAMFKAHTDTEKIPGMFGTLVICLPSAHEGGDVVLKHCGKKMVIKTSEAVQSYACWYSDVTHEVLPVRSGYRWVLTYNMAIDKHAQRPSAALKRSETRALRHTLRRWPDDGPAYLLHTLDHHYTQANVCLNNLKTRDLAQVQTLMDAAQELDFEIFLALIEKEEMGAVEYTPGSRRGYYYNPYDDEDDDDEDDEESYHHIDDIMEENYKIKSLFDLQGRLVAESLSFDTEQMLDPEAFEDLDCDEEDYEGYMGNSGPLATHWYRLTAVVIVPRKAISVLLEKGYNSALPAPGSNLQLLMRYLTRRLLQLDGANSAVHILKELDTLLKAWSLNACMENYDWEHKPSMEGETLLEVGKAAVRSGHYDLFESVAQLHRGALPTDFFTWLQRWLVGKDDVGSEIQKRIRTIKKGLTMAIMSYGSVARRASAIGAWCPLPGSPAFETLPCSDSVLKTVHDAIERCLYPLLSAALASGDAGGLMHLALYHQEPMKFVSERIGPLIKGRADIPAFLLQFVDLLSQHMKRSSASASDAQTFLHTIAEQFVSLIDFSCLTPVSPLPPHEGGYMQRKSHTMDKAAIVTSDSLVAFTRTVLSFGQDEDSLFHQTLARLLSQTKLLPISAFPGLWLPFLGSLASLLAAASVPLDEPCYRELYQTMLKTYLDRSVGPKPRKNASLVRPRVTCDYYSCGDCALLNSFLVDPRRDVGRFAVNKQRRAHLHQELDLAQIDCVHQTERVGSPQTLVVTKTFRQYETALHSWKQCSDAAKAQMQKFDQALLRQVLGDEFNDIVSLKYLLQTPVAPSTSNSVSASSSASASASSRVPLATIPQPERPSMGANTESKTMESSSGVVVGVKRKHELIDLTKD